MKNSPAFLSTTVLLLQLGFLVSSSIAAIVPTTATAPTNGAHDEDGHHVYMVGDPYGWRTLDYQSWADSNTYYVGDVLHFLYSGALEPDYILQVFEWDYETCNMVNPIAMYIRGNDYVTLEHEGDYYFVAGGPDHCKAAGQKFHVKVEPRRIISSSSPAPSSSMSPTMAPSSSTGYDHTTHTSGATSLSSSSFLRMPRILLVIAAVISVAVYV